MYVTYKLRASSAKAKGVPFAGSTTDAHAAINSNHTKPVSISEEDPMLVLGEASG